MASPDSGAWGRRQGHTFQVGQRCETSIKAEAKSPEGESSTYLVDRGGDSAPGVGGSEWPRWEVQGVCWQGREDGGRTRGQDRGETRCSFLWNPENRPQPAGLWLAAFASRTTPTSYLPGACRT